jgi:hypothetical protein
VSDIDWNQVIRFASAIQGGVSRAELESLNMLKTPADEAAYAIALEDTETWADGESSSEVGMVESLPEHLIDGLRALGSWNDGA